MVRCQVGSQFSHPVLKFARIPAYGLEPASPGDEGLPFVAYKPPAMPSKESGQGCAKRTAEGGLALTRFRGMAFAQSCTSSTAFKSVKSQYSIPEIESAFVRKHWHSLVRLNHLYLLSRSAEARAW